jgi:TonB-dependent SusC/RagA subfamily outer membrane receptor
MSPSLRRSALCSFALITVVGCGGRSARPAQPSSRADVTAEDIAKNPNEPIESILQRKVSGITVSRTPDGGVAIRIRGAVSLDGSDAGPLYLLNGLEVSAGPGGALPGVNPFDIESIKVMKGADAALYGIRGANGVIAITTKKPGPRR